MSRNVEELSQMIVGVLSERNGFDDWFLSLDESWQEEILEDIQETVVDWMSETEPEFSEDDENML